MKNLHQQKSSFLFIAVLYLFSCAGSTYKKMSIENPKKLIAIQDSLLSAEPNNTSVVEALVKAHNNLGSTYLKERNYLKAITNYSEAIKLNGLDTLAKYGLLMSKGHLLVNKGNKNGLWDAIEKYSKASYLVPGNGEPFYRIAIAYTKLGDKDFDLILESYEKALALDLSDELKILVQEKYNHAKNRKVFLESFWK